ncbi:MAG: methyltransferase domain-containing protein, partial [Candidatus Marinimicrobia bacterium]|nr:methyltransferase domain-containing protein [Candidatus Neomarinimicrobiota bacterium]
KIPLPDCSVDVVSLHMVVEHLETLPDDLSDIERILKPNGKMIILTTNKWSPLIFLPKLVSDRLKQFLIGKIFNEDDQDIFRTHHRLNSPTRVKRNINTLHFKKLIMIEQTSLNSRLLFWIFLVPYILTLAKGFQYLRSNILAIYQKET